MDLDLFGAPPPSRGWSCARGQHPFWDVSHAVPQVSGEPLAEYFKMSESAAVLSSCYANASLMNYVLYTLHTNPVPASPGRGDSILAGVSSAPGNLPGGHTIIHALLMLRKSCRLYLGCCAADPSIHVTCRPLGASWLTASPCSSHGQHTHPVLPCPGSAQQKLRGSLLSGYNQSWLNPCFALLIAAEDSSIHKKAVIHRASPDLKNPSKKKLKNPPLISNSNQNLDIIST